MNIATSPDPAPQTILIVGGGFAGAVLTLRLLEQPLPLRIIIAEPRAQVGRGVAYSTSETVHLLNGPAGACSVHHEADPDHFANWVRARGRDSDWTPPPGDLTGVYVPRRIFGTYVAGELTRAIAAARGRSSVEHLRDRVSGITRTPSGLIATTEGGLSITADRVVLATGVFPFAEGAAPLDDPRYIRNPWDAAALDPVAAADEVLLIGASLSMVDMVASLEARGFRGRYHVISRRGHLIEGRRDPEQAPPFLDGDNLPSTAAELLRMANARRKVLLARGQDWQAMLNEVRANVLPLWQKASRAERLRFARHLRSLWDVSWHRAAPDSFDAVQRARDEGRFSALAARLTDLKASPDALIATIRPRGSREERVLRVGAVIDCRGHQEHDWRRVSAALPRQLLASGMVRAHDTGFGIDATEDCAVIDREGRVHGDLFALGHPLRGVAWESSSIIEQRAQAARLAQRITQPATV